MKLANEWAKTLLNVYKYLETVIDAIDKIVMKSALNSYYFNGNNVSQNGVMAVANKIINLSERKVKLINVKVLVDRAIEQCGELNAQLLIERYMDDDSAEMIATRHNLNIRTYFRRLAQAEQSMCNAMAKMGYDSKKLSSYLSDEKWIIEILNKYKI
jgi:hypothetical protein